MRFLRLIPSGQTWLAAWWIVLGIAFATAATVSCGGGGGGGSPTAPPAQPRTYVRVSIGQSCAHLTGWPAVGYLTAVSFPYTTSDLSLWPNQPVTVELPRGGAYRGQFRLGPIYDPIFTWDGTVDVPEGQTGQAALRCDTAPMRFEATN